MLVSVERVIGRKVQIL